MPKQYTITLTSKHAHALLRALELYMRCSMGQFHEIGREFEGKNGDLNKQREQGLENTLEHLKFILCPDLAPNSYYGIMSPKSGEVAHLCYELRCAVQYKVSWTEHPLKPGEFPYVTHDKPILFPSGIAPHPECEVKT